MFSLLKRIFGSTPSRKNFQFLEVDRREEIENNRWYRLHHWNSSHFLRMESEWNRDWKIFSNEEEVVGVSYEDRQQKFLTLGDLTDFRIYLAKEPDNPHDKYAIKVMASATLNGKYTVEQLGFLSKETARCLKDEKELDARPYSAYLPHNDCQFGLRIRVLVRSQAYKKKIGHPTPIKRNRVKKKKFVIKNDIRKDVFDDVYDYFDASREDYDCKKVSQAMFKNVFDGFFDDTLKKRGLREADINKTDIDIDMDLADELIDNLDGIVEKLFEIKPDLEKNL